MLNSILVFVENISFALKEVLWASCMDMLI